LFDYNIHCPKRKDFGLYAKDYHDKIGEAEEKEKTWQIKEKFQV